MINPLIERIKKNLDIESDEELIEKLEEISKWKVKIAKRQMKRWHDKGFHPSTELLITLLLEEIEKLKFNYPQIGDS